MRFKINLSKNLTAVPINNINILNSYIHKCLGKNNKYHDTESDYCISHLCGGKMNSDKNTLDFKNGGWIIVSSLNMEFIASLIGGINKPENENYGFGMKFKNIEFINEKFIDGWNHFATLSPFIIQGRKESELIKSYYTIYDEKFQEVVETRIKKKIDRWYPDLDLSNFSVKINNHPSHKTKNVNNGIICNVCHIDIHTNKKVAEAIYNLGIGKSTGSGFGTIYKTENKNIYIF